jgi:DNA-binding NtrC family response regulator
MDTEVGKTAGVTLAPPPGSDRDVDAMTLLVVDDDVACRERMVVALRQSGYNVLDAPMGREALWTADRHPGPIHLLVSRLRMSEMTGPELRDRLRARRPGTRVLFVSAHSPHILETEDSRTAFLQKPFEGSALVRTVRELLG